MACRKSSINLECGRSLTRHAVWGKFQQNIFMGVCILLTTVIRVTHLIFLFLNFPRLLSAGLIVLHVKIVLPSKELQAETKYDTLEIFI